MCGDMCRKVEMEMVVVMVMIAMMVEMVLEMMVVTVVIKMMMMMWVVMMMLVLMKVMLLSLFVHVCTHSILISSPNCPPCSQINVGDIVREMRLQRYGMIQTKVSGYRGSKFRGQHLNTANQHPPDACTLCRPQEQYLFCYKVWLDVLQGILRLHGNQWQPDAPLEIQMV